MKLIVGLGNVGEEYKDNRHNVGFFVLDSLAHELGIKDYELREKLQSSIISFQPARNRYPQVLAGGSSVILAKPRTMMNESGRAVASLAAFYKIPATDIYIVYDDLDIALGEYKIQKGKGPKDHKGIISVDKALGTRQYWHVRVGIENRKDEEGRMKKEGDRISGEQYVLQDFTDKELEVLKLVIDKIIKDLINQLAKL